eukprot:5559641-Alexandrium_andersonii.AAC.1
MGRRLVSNLALHSSERRVPWQAAAHGRGCTSSIRPYTRAPPAWPARCSHASGHAQPADADAGQPPGQRAG